MEDENSPRWSDVSYGASFYRQKSDAMTLDDASRQPRLFDQSACLIFVETYKTTVGTFYISLSLSL